MELIERIERAEAELLWSIGDDSGPGPSLLGMHATGLAAFLTGYSIRHGAD
jgi:hypothetical protein